MLKVHEIQEKRAGLIAAGKAIETKATAEKRDALTPEENAEFARIAGEIEALNGLERSARIVDEAERRAHAEPVTDREMSRELRGYSLAKAVQESSAGRITGLEAEMHQELSKGRAEVRGVMIPTEVLFEPRGQSVGSNSAGGYTVGTQLATVADRINRPALKVESLGATVMRGLSGFIDLPNLASSGAASWVGEDGPASQSDATFSKVSMGPKTVAGEYRLTRRLLLQAASSIEDLLRRDLGSLLVTALDAAAIAGTGTNNQPRGILNTSGVQSSTASIYYLGDTVADLIAKLEVADIAGTRGVLINPTIAAVIRKQRDGAARPFDIASSLHNERYEISSQVPSNLGTAHNKSAVICGIWSELVIGYWSAVDILANPYHIDVASRGGVLLHAFLDCDVAARHPQAFSYSLVRNDTGL